MQEMFIVIVDDEKRMRDGLAKVVESSGRDARIIGSFSNGLEAYEWMKAHPDTQVDLFFTDIMMPVMDGLQVISRLKKERPELPCVIISGFDDFEYARQGLKYGAMDYLLKPLNFDDILQLLDRVRGVEHSGKPADEALTLSKGSSQRVVSEFEKEHRIVEQVKAILHRQYGRDISLQQLAEQTYASSFYVSKLFRKETGMTVTDYLLQVRMAKAKQLLENRTDLKIFEVSERVGYSDAAYFARMFKRIIGVTPKEYRERQ